MYLDNKTFKTVIASTPLIAIDLIVVNDKKEMLLGKRLNQPAKDFWFVPGGRVLKNETLVSAFTRLTLIELGKKMELKHAQLLGVFEHFYQESVFGDQQSTHYVNAAHVIKIGKEELSELPIGEQHGSYSWHAIDGIQNNSDVHKYTKEYIPVLLEKNYR